MARWKKPLVNAYTRSTAVLCKTSIRSASLATQNQFPASAGTICGTAAIIRSVFFFRPVGQFCHGLARAAVISAALMCVARMRPRIIMWGGVETVITFVPRLFFFFAGRMHGVCEVLWITSPILFPRKRGRNSSIRSAVCIFLLFYPLPPPPRFRTSNICSL